MQTIINKEHQKSFFTWYLYLKKQIMFIKASWLFDNVLLALLIVLIISILLLFLNKNLTTQTPTNMISGFLCFPPKKFDQEQGILVVDWWYTILWIILFIIITGVVWCLYRIFSIWLFRNYLRYLKWPHDMLTLEQRGFKKAYWFYYDQAIYKSRISPFHINYRTSVVICKSEASIKALYAVKKAQRRGSWDDWGPL